MVAAGVALALQSVGAQNILTNPSFETTVAGAFSSPYAGFNDLAPSSSIVGWTNVLVGTPTQTDGVLLYRAPGFAPLNAPTASNGANAVMFNGDGTVTNYLVSSSFLTTAAQSYSISFDVGLQPLSSGGTFSPASLQVYLTTDPNPANLGPGTIVAQSSVDLTNTDLGAFRSTFGPGFAGQGPGVPLYLIFGQSDGGVLSPTLDNVVVAVPEPQTYFAGVFALAITGFLFFWRRTVGAR